MKSSTAKIIVQVRSVQEPPAGLIGSIKRYVVNHVQLGRVTPNAPQPMSRRFDQRSNPSPNLNSYELLNDRKSAFALVVALSLMAFVLLLIVSMVSLIQVETVHAKMGRDQLKARLNAQLAAMVALGDVQKLAGSDQRVSARADILIPPGVNPIEGQAHWTGIWSSKLQSSGNVVLPSNDAVDLSVGLDQHKPQWLVSGDRSDLVAKGIVDPDSNHIIGKISVDDAVKMATVGNSVEDLEQEVHVFKEPITEGGSTTAGAFAYWVSDEGLKARVNLSYPSILTTQDEKYYRFALAQQGDPTVATAIGGDQPFLQTDSLWKQAGGGALIEKVLSSEDLGFISTNAATAQAHQKFFHDLSVHSQSLFTNVKNGGLKRDLSALLRDIPSSTLKDQLIFPTSSGRTSIGAWDALGNGDADPGGPKWLQLGDYYKLTTSLPATGPISIRQPTNDQIGFTPIVAHFHLIQQGFAELDNNFDSSHDLAAEYTYCVGYFPLITLWNPYDRDMLIDQDITITTDFRGADLAAATASPYKKIGQLLPKSGLYVVDQSRVMMGFTIGKGFTIPAGEAMNFTPPNNSRLNLYDPKMNVLKHGASDTWVRGFFSPPRTYADIAGTSNQSLPFADTRLAGGKCVQQMLNLNLGAGNYKIEDRIFHLKMNGWGEPYKDGPKFAKASDYIDFYNIKFSMSVIEPEGSSILAPYDDNTYFDFLMFRGNHRVSGSSAILNLPRNAPYDFSPKVHILSQFNLRSPLVCWHAHSSLNYGYRSYYQGPGKVWIDATPNYLDGTASANPYIGLANTASNGSDQMVLFEAPTRPPLSVGQLMHANLINVDRVSDTKNGGHHSNYGQPHTTPSYAIGNSSANINLPLSRTMASIHDGTIYTPGFFARHNAVGVIYDYSYLLNEALWDDFYFSTILPGNLTGITFPLPNARIRKWDTSATDAELTDAGKSAGYLMLDGGFNVNSTSVAAWEAVLGALRNVDTLGELPADSTLLHPYSRFIEPLLESTDALPDYGSSAERDALVAGFRSLTDAQITSLAQQIVKELKHRRSKYGYPFLSLAAFINRSILQADIDQVDRTRFAYCGLLQFAIDQSEVNGEPALDQDWQPKSTATTGLWQNADITVDFSKHYSSTNPYLPESLEVIRNRPFVDNFPGSLSPADLLSKLGAILAPRSDTFTIRSYGNVLDPISGNTTSEAYFEIVVQRTPRYVDASDAVYEPASTTLNQRFGRRFEIVSSRWLDADEI